MNILKMEQLMPSTIDFLTTPEKALALDIPLGQDIDWLTQLRQQGLQQLQQSGLPTRKQLHWRYTNLNPITNLTYTLPATPALNQDAKQHIAAATLADSITLVFVNGQLNHELSQLNALPEDLQFVDFQRNKYKILLIYHHLLI